MKPVIFHIALATAASVSLISCSEGPRDDYNPEATKPEERLSVENARMVLPAVAGNPGVVYFDLTYLSGGAPTLDSVEVDGVGSTEIHGTDMVNGKATMGKANTISLMARQAVNFEPGGYHIMAMKPSDTLQAGGETSMTVTLSNGEKTTVAVPIQAAGDDR